MEANASLATCPVQKAKDAIDEVYADIEGRNLDACIEEMRELESHVRQRLADLRGH